MSFFTALLDAAGGYGAGRQQRLQNQQYQQTLDQNQQYRQAEEARQDSQLAIQQAAEARTAAEYNANRGLDAQGKPLAPLPVALGKQIANLNTVGAPQHAINALYQAAQYYYGQGEKDKGDIAAAQADAIQKGLLESQGQAATLNRDLLLNIMTTRRDAADKAAPTYADVNGTYADHNPKPLSPTEKRAADQEAWNAAHGYPPGYTGNDMAAQSARRATRLKSDFDSFWNNATTVTTTTNRAGMKVPVLDPKTGQPKSSVISPQDQMELKQEFAQMDETSDPIGYARKLLKSIPRAPAAIKRAIVLRAQWRAEALESEGTPTTVPPIGGYVPTAPPAPVP